MSKITHRSAQEETKGRRDGGWHHPCRRGVPMKEVEMWKVRLDVTLAILLLMAISVSLVFPVRNKTDKQTPATNLFAIVEGDFQNPILSSPAIISVLNGATKGFAQFAGYDEFSARVDLESTTEVMSVTRFAGDLLGMLDAEWLLKGTLSAATPTVYISESFWRRAFQGDAEIVGRELRLNQTIYRIGGVVRAPGEVLADTELWIPMRSRGPLSEMSSMRIVGRLAWGRDFAGAQRFIAKTFRTFVPDQHYGDSPGAFIMPLSDLISASEFRPAFAASVKEEPVSSGS